MRAFMKKAAVLLLALMVAGSGGCGGPSSSENKEAVQPGYLYGIDYIAYEWACEGVDYRKGFELMHNLGVKSIRHWMHVTWFFDENFQVKQDQVDLMKDIIAEAQKYDFQLIGMSHRNINRYGPEHENDKVSRSSGYYKEWLENYERGWYELAKLFPEITIWEIDNETNNNDFMKNAEGTGEFDLQEMTDISTDLFYYGSRGVHRANPDALTVMGGFVTWNGQNFLQGVYENIKSGQFGEGSTDPDDYFQAVAWHPYTQLFNADRFVEDNQTLYNIILENEGKDKKVYFTEFGGWDHTKGEEQSAEYLREAYRTIEEKLPFVESAQYFRAFNHIYDNRSLYGMFHDPNPAAMDMIRGAGQRAVPGSPKLSAYTYQEIAGGEGSLEVMESDPQ